MIGPARRRNDRFFFREKKKRQKDLQMHAATMEEEGRKKGLKPK